MPPNVGRWFRAIDPGGTRLEHSLKGILAVVTAALATLGVTYAFAAQPTPKPAAYALLLAFLCFVVVTDSRAAARRRALLLAALPLMGAPLVAALMTRMLLLSGATLLTLMFLAYFVRRYGVLPAELAMLGAFAYYFAAILRVTWVQVPWFALAGGVAVLACFFWQFVVRPYDPRRYLVRVMAAFNHSVADALDEIGRELSSTARPGSARRALDRLRTARRAIEQQLAGVQGVDQWVQESLGALRLQLLYAEQSVERMAAAAAELTAQRDVLPTHTLNSATTLLAALRATLAGAASPAQHALLEPTGAGRAARALGGGQAESLAQSASLQFYLGGLQVANSVQTVRDLYARNSATRTHSERDPNAQPAGIVPALPKQPGARPPARVHPATALGIQAVVAAGLAILVNRLLDLDHPNWTYWTAFMVVAGSTGESLRKIVYRVVGTVLGAFGGTLLAVALPSDAALVLPLIMLCLFLALFTYSINYLWMPFWATVAAALAFGLVSRPPQDLIVDRPLNTIIGGAVAALAVWFVLPARAGAHFQRALSRYLATADDYLAALERRAGGPTGPAELNQAELALSDTYDTLALTFPSVALEYNPLSQVRSPLTAQATVVSALHSDLSRYAAVAAQADTEQPAADDATQRMLATIHANIQSLLQLIDSGSAPPFRTIADPAGADEVQHGSGLAAGERGLDSLRGLVFLGRVNQSILELGSAMSPDSRAPMARDGVGASGSGPYRE